MIKTPERLALEEEIRNAHNACNPIANKIALEKFSKGVEELNGDEEVTILADIRAAIKHLWDIYVGGQDKLFELEKREDFMAFKEYAKHIDSVGRNLPPQNKMVCYNPFSGLDLLWARIFQHFTCEDIAFNVWHPLFGWWKPEDYSPQRRWKIVRVFKKEGLIPATTTFKFIRGDSNIENKYTKNLNNSGTTLFLKRGHDNLGFLRKRFLDLSRPIMFGAIVFESGFYGHPLEEVEGALVSHNYELILKYKAFVEDDLEYSIPYALGPGGNNTIFIKKS